MTHMPFEKLEIWKRGMCIAKQTYTATSQFPYDKKFGLVSQMRRCAISVPSNIAEGSQRRSDKDFAHFIRIAKGSLAELRTQCYLARELQFLEKNTELLQNIIELDKMLYKFHSTLV